MTFMDLLERLMYKLTSGRFIFTIVCAAVFSYLAIHGTLKEDRVMEVLLIVLYAYFARPRVDEGGSIDNGNIDAPDAIGAPPKKTTNTTTTLTK
jgi:ABC-type methionine transport system permease subunit